MISLKPGLCCVCQRSIADDGRARSLYSEIAVKMKSGTVCHVGICSECSIAEHVLGELTEALKKVNAMSESDVIDQYDQRIALPEVLKTIQGGLCAVCNQEIGEHWVITNGRMRHEGC